MARQILLTQTPTLNISQAGLALVTLLLCAFAVVIKCATHTRKLRRQWRACYNEFFDEDDDEPVIEINHQFMIANHQVNGNTQLPEEAAAVDTSVMFSREQPVWKKNILMGEKCQLPDFSGVILYDSEGNVVAPSKTPHPLLTWK